MSREGPCFITRALEEDGWGHTVTAVMCLLSARHCAHGGGAATQQVEQDRPGILLLFGKILIEGAFKELPISGWNKGERSACSRAGKPSQDFGNVAVLCLLKSVETVVCLFMPEEDFY